MSAALEGVTLRRRSGRTEHKTVLDDVSMALRPGEVTALIGPNGAGKSTALAVLAGDLCPTTGRALLDDRPVGDWSPIDRARRRAVLAQAATAPPAFTATEVVAMARWPWGDESPERVVAALARVDATDLADRPVSRLSGGEAARVHLARALAQDTPVLLLDEPGAAFDLPHQALLWDVLVSAAAEGRAVAVVVHELTSAALADRVVLLADGRVVADGTPDEVLTAEVLGGAYGSPVRVVTDPDTGRPIVLPGTPAGDRSRV